MSARERLRHLALSALSALPNAGGVDDDRVVFLAFHYLFDDDVPNFRRLLDALAEEYTFLGVGEAVDALAAGQVTGRNLCFTCDDGFRSCLQAGTILREYGARGCFFLCPSFLGLNDPDANGRTNRERLGGPPIEFLERADVETLLAGGHEIGNHTWSHRNLGLVDDDVAREEVERGRAELERDFGPIRHFACPYGHPAAYTDAVLGHVRTSGHETFFTTTRGAHRNGEGVPRLVRRQHFEPFWPVAHSRLFLRSERLGAGGAAR